MKYEKALDVMQELKANAASANRLHRYRENLSTNSDVKLFDDNMYHYLMEHGNSKLVHRTKNYLDSIGFAQSVYDYQQIVDAVERFEMPNHRNYSWNEHYRAAFEVVYQECQAANLKSLQYRNPADVVNAIPRKDTHAGFSYLVTGKRKKGEYLEDLYTTLEEQFVVAKREQSFNKPILVGTRTTGSGAFDALGNHTGTCKHRSRFVSMIDIIVIMAETKFAKPFQNWLASNEWYAGGKDDNTINGFIQRWRSRGYHMLTIDYSSYDQTISDWLIRDAFKCIRAAFRNDPLFDDELYDVIITDFIEKIFIMPDGMLGVSKKGVPSGSMFTQIIDSIVNRIMILTYAFSKGVDIRHMMIMGDDNIIFSVEQIDTDDLAGYLSRVFGIVCNPEKCTQTAPYRFPEFLSRQWQPSGVYREPKALISKLLYPEKFRNYHESPQMSPLLILDAYRKTFPLGMRHIMSDSAFRDELSFLSFNKDGDGALAKWMNGLERYRRLYLS